MFGFIEEQIANILISLGVITSYEKFAISDGTTIAIIGRNEFTLVRDALRRSASQFGYSDEDVKVINSDIAGMKTILHPFWFNDPLFDAITPGPVKEMELYLKIRRDVSSSRFPFAAFLSYITEKIESILNNTERISEEDEELDGDNAIHEAVHIDAEPTATTNASPEIPDDPAILFLTKLEHSLGINFDHLRLDDGEVVYAHKNSCLLNMHVYELAKSLKKHVVIFDDIRMTGSMKLEMKAIQDELKQKIIFVYPRPSHPKLYTTGVKMTHSLFGFDINSLHQLHGGITLNDNNDPTNPHPLGPVFAEFDYAYRDYKTGVIWALQRKHEVFFTFDLKTANSELVSIIMQELCDRYCGSLSYEMMLKRDIDYFERSSANDKSLFLKLAIKNSKNLIEDLKSRYLQAKESYVENMTKAMEFAKVTQRLEENIMAIDENKLSLEEADRCEKMYNDVVSIPKVSAVKVTDNAVNVYTKNIYVMHEKTKKFHDIGTFHIVIGMYGTSYDSSNTVKIFNTKHQVHAFNELMQAPHVFEDGHLCHGNIVGNMVDAYKRRDLYQMVLIIIMFLESANLDDPAGVYLKHWPIVTDETAKSCEMKDEFAKIFEAQTEEESKFDDALDIPIHI